MGVPEALQPGVEQELTHTPVVELAQTYQPDIPQQESIAEQVSSRSERTQGVQTGRMLSGATPRKRRLRAQLRAARRTIQRKRRRRAISPQHELDAITHNQFLYLAQRFLPAQCMNFIKHQIGLTGSSRGNRYSPELKKFALVLYFLSPKAYKYLSQTFCLPSKRLLHRMVGKVNISTGINECLMHLLAYKYRNIKEQQKHCVLYMDEVALKAHAYYDRNNDRIVGLLTARQGTGVMPVKNALVLMIRSIAGGWKQPVAYYFMETSCASIEVQQIVFKTIEKLAEIELEVNCLVHDQGSNFIQFLNNLGVTVENPYFEWQGRKIVALYDMCHLIKSLRNNLIKYNYYFEGQMASWDHLESLYHDMIQRNLRLCPKLTEKHVKPNNFQKMRVKLATQVFSHTVSAALNAYVSFGSLPAAASGTATFFETINNFFDLFNSSCIRHPNCYKRAFASEEAQVALLDRCKQMFKNLQVKTKLGANDVTRNIKCIRGFTAVNYRITIVTEDIRGQRIYVSVDPPTNTRWFRKFFW